VRSHVKKEFFGKCFQSNGLFSGSGGKVDAAKMKVNSMEGLYEYM